LLAYDRGQHRVVSLILSFCAGNSLPININQAEQTMNATPIYAAAFDGYFEVVKLLIGMFTQHV
jgi:hypothetical protein